MNLMNIFKSRDKPRNSTPGQSYGFLFGGTSSGKENFWVVYTDWIVELGKAVKALDGYHMNWLLKGVV